MTSGNLRIPFTLRLDHLSSLMILVVTGIGSLIHIYSTGYMHDESDGEYARYFSYLNLFASFMLVLVLGANFPVMFVGWEGVGLCSYLLIGFWFRKQSAADAGKKAFIVNRVGDFGFVLGMLLIFATFGTLDFQQVAAAADTRAIEHGIIGVLTIATLLLFLGATGKSAQIPLYVWLPDAMEGPTPVSALIHAATMVTAGVYMIGTERGPVLTRADHDVGGRGNRGGDRLDGGNDWPRPERHQACARVLDRLAARIHVPGDGCGRVRGRHLPSLYACLLQGAAVPWIGRGHSRAGRRAGSAQHGRIEEVSAGDLLDVLDRSAGDRGRALPVWVLQQGRDSVQDVHVDQPVPPGAVGRRYGDVAAHRNLHVPPGVPGVSR